ncbi:unnamed protein product [Adineta steineri]|uniref:Uncharacterized protein n=1 Tax=Adineta steineri TaxID=433720 RepID=A0A819FZW5_9BILA|nr:unnamed protein product [Adineta steineri]CAF0730747.1 unnamed protein product [Adineta steineri]CAF1408706.1 unnamed protein product [Adineta steineri]CAF3800963.1 unnamed protein product [Adineta steineri]CAF3820183.1 unnamed protein product [Adineta steineri]
MRYPCIGFPSCLKTFENGYVLRNHQLSCEHAQREINNRYNRQEHARTIRYDYTITGMKMNQFYPTAHGLDHVEKLHFRNFSKAGYTTKQEPYRSRLLPLDSLVVKNQARSTAMDFSGYYT